MRYFGGAEPEHLTSGKLYETGDFVLVNQLMEVLPGIFLVRTVSQKKGTLELPELTLAIKRSNGATPNMAADWGDGWSNGPSLG
jgi:7,8-dihydropterin-6-yl-methyl-4-(beta-D-ribofuranosyl)aminobenzene 5'-phosphate synthase